MLRSLETDGFLVLFMAKLLRYTGEICLNNRKNNSQYDKNSLLADINTAGDYKRWMCLKRVYYQHYRPNIYLSGSVPQQCWSWHVVKCHLEHWTFFAFFFYTLIPNSSYMDVQFRPPLLRFLTIWVSPTRPWGCSPRRCNRCRPGNGLGYCTSSLTLYWISDKGMHFFLRLWPGTKQPSVRYRFVARRFGGPLI